jgi:predicted phage terminase large subunit-like protein
VDIPSEISVDRALASRSLYQFVRMAWPHVDPNPFIDGWHIEEICAHLEGVSVGRIRRLVINLPPGFSKSTLTGVLWPAWDWIRRPERRWFYCSYDVSLMTRDAGKLIRLIASEWFQARWPALKLSKSSPAVTDFRTTSDGGRFSTSFKGRAVGRHAHIQVFDDPHKPLSAMGDSLNFEETDQLIANTFASRAVDPETFARVIVMQCIGPEDVGMRAASRGWLRLWFPMLYEADNACPADRRRTEGEPLCAARVSAKTCEELRQSLDEVDPLIWTTQYQQRPTLRSGGLIKEEWIEKHGIMPEDAARLRLVGERIQSWDLTFKDKASSDFIAGQWWTRHEGHFYLLDEPVFELASFLDTLIRIQEKRETWAASACLIEDKANGPAIMNVLKADGNSLIEPFEPVGSKAERLHACSPLFSRGKVHLVRGPWFDRMKSTIVKFPAVRRDDEVDACTMALIRLNGGSALAEALAEITERMRTAA